MIKRYLTTLIVVLFNLVLISPASAYAATTAGPNMTQFGFPNVLAKATVNVGHAESLKSGDITINIPANAFSVNVNFELLGGNNGTFQPLLSNKSKEIVDNFAFKVTNLSNGQIISTFNAPVIASITNPKINSTSEYMNTTPTKPIHLTNNPKAPTITGDTLTHPNPISSVGWVVISSISSSSSSSPKNKMNSSTKTTTNNKSTSTNNTKKTNKTSSAYLYVILAIIIIAGMLIIIYRNMKTTKK